MTFPVPRRLAAFRSSGESIFSTYWFTSRRLLSTTIFSMERPIMSSMPRKRASMVSDSAKTILLSGSFAGVMTPLSCQT